MHNYEELVGRHIKVVTRSGGGYHLKVSSITPFGVVGDLLPDQGTILIMFAAIDTIRLS